MKKRKRKGSSLKRERSGRKRSERSEKERNKKEERSLSKEALKRYGTALIFLASLTPR